MLVVVCFKVIEGYILLDSLGDYLYIFDELFCLMVVVGEKLGYFDLVLECLVDYVENC